VSGPLEFGEQELRHVIHMQINVSIGQNLLVCISLCLVRLDGLLRDCEQQQAPARDLACRSFGVLLQEPLAILLDTLKRTPELRLLQADTSIEDDQLHNPDHIGQAAVVIAWLFSTLDVRLDAKHDTEAEQWGAVPVASKFMTDQRH